VKFWHKACLCSFLILHKQISKTKQTQKTEMNMLPSTSGTTTTTTTALGGWTVLQLSKIRNNRSVSSSFSLRISATCDDRPHGPSCIYVGPLQTATQETLEALYSQVINFYFTLSLTISLHKHYLRWLIHLINLLFIIC
jgi:hypothetical protein